MKIQILGTGCAKCLQTERIVRDAVKQTGIDAEVVKVTDAMEIVSLGIMSTPAVLIDGKVACSGHVPTLEQVKGWLADAPTAASSCGCGCCCSR